MADTSNTVEPLRHSDSDGVDIYVEIYVDIYVETVGFIRNCVTVVE